MRHDGHGIADAGGRGKYIATARGEMNMESTRKHPDLFTPEEAAAYLHLDSERGLETLREKFGLVGYNGVNKRLLYYREDLDACVLQIVCNKPNRPGIE